jgi:phosphoglycolate phosphatase-like HAD superfamily hydrolase
MSNIIFDFDGTLADSFALVVEIIHELTGRDEPLPPNEIERLRGMTLRQAAKEVHMPFWKIPFLLARGRKQLWAEMGKVQIFPGMADVIQQLTADGHRLYIMSSNSVQNIEVFLEKNELQASFLKIYGNVGLLGKASVLKRILKQNELDPKQTWYVGDEVRDLEGSHKAGIRVIAVTWGYNNAKVLESHQPEVLVSTISELAAAFHI